MGVNGSNELKTHVWFKEFDWLNLYQLKLAAPLKPLQFVNYFDEKKLYSQRLKYLEYNNDKAVEMVNKELIDNYEFQKLF